MNPTKLNQQTNVDTHMETPKRPVYQRLIAIGVIIGLLAGAAFIAMQLIKTKPKAKKRPPKKIETLVNVMGLKPGNHTVTIQAMGTVIPEKEVIIQPQVSGQVLYLHPNLKPGGKIKKGDILMKLDRKDYLYTVQQRTAALKQAEADLLLEKGNQTVAQHDWKVIQSLVDNVSDAAVELALRKPQLLKAKASVNSARSALRQAQLNLSRTTVKAPFNAIVLNKNIDIGSIVSTQTQVATLVGIDRFWVQTSIPKDRLKWIATDQPAITIVHDQMEHTGELSSLEADLEKNGLMAKLLIGVSQPLVNPSAPLLLGSFVDANIQGKTLENVYRIPATAVNENGEIMIATDNKLEIRTPVVHWKDAVFAYISGDIEPKEKLIVSKISAPVPDMPLQIVGNKKKKKQKMTQETGQSNE